MDKAIDELINHPVYYANYLGLVIFTMAKHKAIWKAACGGNGQIQLTELAQLFALYFFFSYCQEIIYHSLPADFAMVCMLLGIIGFAQYQSNQLKKDQHGTGSV